MPKNLEFKAQVGDLISLESLFQRKGASLIGTLSQRDTYFIVPRGRLKLRECEGKTAELIFYERDESSAAGMESLYSILQVKDLSLKDFLSKALGVRTVVEKKRTLLLLRNARIHLDNVRDLGTFIEFEVVSGESESRVGDDKADAALLETLKGYAAPFVVKEISESYSDLMLKA